MEEGWSVHRSVKMRLEWDPNYIPRARPSVPTGRIVQKKGKDEVERKARLLTREEWNTDAPQHFTWVPANEPTLNPFVESSIEVL